MVQELSKAFGFVIHQVLLHCDNHQHQCQHDKSIQSSAPERSTLVVLTGYNVINGLTYIELTKMVASSLQILSGKPPKIWNALNQFRIGRKGACEILILAKDLSSSPGESGIFIANASLTEVMMQLPYPKWHSVLYQQEYFIMKSVIATAILITIKVHFQKSLVGSFVIRLFLIQLFL